MGQNRILANYAKTETCPSFSEAATTSRRIERAEARPMALNVSQATMKKIAIAVLLPFSAWVFVALLSLFVLATENTRGEFKAAVFFVPIAALLLLTLSIALILFRRSERFYVPSWFCSAASSALYIAFAFDTETESHR